MVKKLNEAQFETIKQDQLAVVDFSATWCGPCRMLAPILEEIAEELEGQMNFYNVDVDESSNLAMQYGIMSVPSIVVFKNGEKVAQSIGVQPKEKLRAFFKEQQ